MNITKSKYLASLTFKYRLNLYVAEFKYLQVRTCIHFIEQS